ncbi:hypothetical protein ACE4RV_07450 [Acetobacter persici]|uniref:Uncharacterized protein n=1 Tax=Gluconacetobacter sacchari TaxID=92759 RepID=A0A7W4IH68_9PROT|nr:hypothetical protein [Gluconacetobacter sacchari]MBB2162819.1 hypothetical protein [Gluconacetobacter sacchari]
MPRISNVIRLQFPKSAAQSERLERLARGKRIINVGIIVIKDENRFQEQRAWRTLFGLYQDCASVRWSKGFKKTPGKEFLGKMHPERLTVFLNEALPLVEQRRAIIRVNGERVRRGLRNVMVA